MKQKIVISVTNDIVYDQRMLKTARSLIRCGFEVHIIGRLKKDSHPDQLDGRDFNSYRFKLWFTKGKFFYLEYNLRLLFYLLKQKATIFCAVDLDTILPNIIIGRLRRIPVIYDAHEYFTEVPELADRRIEISIWKWIEKKAIPQCRSMYTVSNQLAYLFTREYNRKVDIIYNYPFSLNKNTATQKEDLILYQGDLNMGRGLELAIQAMRKLEGYNLVIIGDGYHRLFLENWATQCGVNERVEFIGKLTPGELKSYTQKARFGLNLLENKGLNYYYSLANKFFDYMQAGVIPITMNFPEYYRIQREYNCAILINALDEEEYLSALHRVISIENNYLDLLKNVDIAASFLTWENQEEKLCSIYKNA